MLLWTTPKTWITDEFVDAAELNQYLRDALNALNSTPAAYVFHSTTQPVGNDGWTLLPFDSEAWDTENMHHPTVNNSLLEIKTAGKWLFIGHVTFPANPTGVRGLRIRKNGAAWGFPDMRPAFAANDTTLTVVAEDVPIVGTYYELEAYQSSGVQLNVAASSFLARRQAE